MQFSKALLAAALYASSAVAQIAFTSVPASVQAGQEVTLRWNGGNDAPVTITLQNGPADDLQTVSLITGKATGSSYSFTLPKTLANGRYAFKISQGQDDVNYSGMFTFSGGSDSPTSTSLSLVSTISSSSSPSATSLQAAIASINSTVSSLTAAPKNGTTTAFVPLGTGASGASSAGTGTVLHRNTTLSHASLKTSTATATTTSGAGSSQTASSTSSSAASTSSSAASPVAVEVASPLALVLSAFMAVVYLG